jgi:DNA-binding LacI/PurR family transcriptional regulator
LKGYKSGLEQFGIPFDPDLAIPTESSEPGGFELGMQLLSQSPPPTAVILSYELPAGGLYRALTQQGVQPGAELAVIGFRDSPLTRHLVPKLTCFTTSLKDLGIALGETLLSRVPRFKDDYADVPLERIWPLDLLPGDSDPPPRHGALRSKST